MPALQRAPKIQKTEWDAHKLRIIELYIDDKLELTGPNGVIETMKNEGFSATKSQYEHQFRTWKVRKYMKRHEWDRLFQARPQGGDLALITPENMRIPATRLERARRRYAPRIPREAISLDSGNTAQGNVEPLLPIGDSQIPVGNPTFETAIATTEPDRRTNTAASENFHGAFSNDDQSMTSHDISGTLTSWIGLPDQIDSPNIRPQALGWHDMDLHTTLDFSIPFEPSIFDLTHMDAIGAQYKAPSPRPAGVSFGTPPELVQYLLSSAAPSPYLRGACELRRNEWKPPSAIITSKLIEDIYNNARTALPHGSGWGGFYMANRFLTAINEVVSTGRSSMVDVEDSPITHTLALANLLSAETFFGEEFVQPPNDIAIDIATEVRPYIRLIRSAINGFTGLENIPAAGILRFLMKHPAAQLSVIRFLCFNTGPVARSLAENIFRAALEGDDVDIIEFLLDHTKMVDANDTVCHYRGGKYTPLEIAAVKSSFGVLKLLIHRKVDVTKSFPRDDDSGALTLLIKHSERKARLDDRFLELVDALTEAGATTSTFNINQVLRDFVDPRLATHLIQYSASHFPLVLISNGSLLVDIVRNLEQTNAIKMMELIIDKSRGLNVDWPYSLCTNDALREAVGRGYEGVVGILIPYAPSPWEILQIARRARNQAIIDLILLSRPGCDKEAEEINSLLAALEFGDQDWLLTLGETDVINRLKSHERGQVLTAALQAGNLEFATKILDLDPDFKFAHRPAHEMPVDQSFNPASAFAGALAHNFDVIAWDILALCFNANYDYVPERFSTLYFAVKEKKPDFIRAILDFSFDLRPSEMDQMIEAAIEWGDSSIIIDLYQAQEPAYVSREILAGSLKFAAQRGLVDLFWSTLEEYCNSSGLVIAGEIAIECNNLTLLNELLLRGAIEDDTELLRYATSGNPSFVRSILGRYRETCPQGHPKYSTYCIVEAIQCSSESVELLDMFLEFELVAEDDFRGKIRNESLLTKAIGHWDCSCHARLPNIDFIKRLIDAGSDVNTTGSGYENSDKITALLRAIDTKNMEVVKLLVQRGAKVNEPASFRKRRTPLQRAAELNNLEIVSFLLEKDADVNAPPAKFSGATALQFAAIHGNCHMAMMLIEHGARLDVPPPVGPDGRWPLEGAAENGRLDMIQFLWDANGGPFDDKQCRKAMRLAEHQGRLGCRDMIKELMAKHSIEY